MLTSLHIKNFQSHKDSYLEFDPGINVIVGQSDSGKTAVLRALKWVLTNRPGGEAFRSSWGGDTKVSLRIGADIIEREKGKENLYLLNGLGFKAFGTEVPEEIVTILNMNEINIQNQLDLPFLLRDSPGQVAAHFNKVANLESIDRSTQAIEKQIRTISQKISHTENLLKEREEELQKYDYLEDMEKDVADAEWMEEQLKNTEKKIAVIASKLEALEETYQKEQKIARILIFSDIVEQALAMNTVIIQQEESCGKLEVLLQHLRIKDKHMKRLSALIALDAEVQQASDLFDSQKEKEQEMEKLVSHLVKLKSLNVDRAEKEIAALEKEFNTNMPDTCPLCGR